MDSQIDSQTPGGRRFPVAALALIIGMGLGWLIFRKPGGTGPEPAAEPPTSDYIVIVGPDAATLNYPTAYIGWNNRIIWQNLNQEALSIVFPISDLPTGVKIAPFDSMTPAKQHTDNGDIDVFAFKYPLNSYTTASGQPSAALKALMSGPGHEHGRLDFKYGQELAGKYADGHIIIKW